MFNVGDATPDQPVRLEVVANAGDEVVRSETTFTPAGPPKLTGRGTSPGSAPPGSSLTLDYDIANDSDGSASLVLGASIRLGGGAWISDAAGDAAVSVPPGPSTQTRRFKLQETARGWAPTKWRGLF